MANYILSLEENTNLFYTTILNHGNPIYVSADINAKHGQREDLHLPWRSQPDWQREFRIGNSSPV
jgi:hypothetical protein